MAKKNEIAWARSSSGNLAHREVTPSTRRRREEEDHATKGDGLSLTALSTRQVEHPP